MSATPRAALREWLEQRHAAVMAAESRALACLEKGALPGHAEGMREKAGLLAAIREDVAPLLAALPADMDAQERERLHHRLRAFSASANNALRLGSLFYMSALLYPEDHKPGQPDDMQVFIASLTD